jgi:hypothetical protein
MMNRVISVAIEPMRYIGIYAGKSFRRFMLVTLLAYTPTTFPTGETAACSHERGAAIGADLEVYHFVYLRVTEIVVSSFSCV